MPADKESITTTLAMTNCPSPSTQTETNNHETTETLTIENHTLSYACKDQHIIVCCIAIS